MGEPTRVEADAVAEIVERANTPRTLTAASPLEAGKDACVFAIPKGMELYSAKKWIDEFKVRPERRAGTATLHDVDSFIGHAKRFAGVSSAIFGDATQPTSPRLISVIDYHDAGKELVGESLARHGQHRGVYTCPLSEEWKRWTTNTTNLSQTSFAELLEAGIADVLDPAIAGENVKAYAARIGCSFASPNSLMALSRGLALTVSQRVQGTVNLGSGEGQIAFVTEHQDQKGQPLTVPGAFILAIPVFRSGQPYQIPVRLRYRHNDGKITWSFELYRKQAYFDDAFADVCKRAATETGLPLFMGTPE